MNTKEKFEAARVAFFEAARELNEEIERVKQERPITVICNDCGKEEKVLAVFVFPENDGTFSLMFGSAADFCGQCGSSNVRQEGTILCA